MNYMTECFRPQIENKFISEKWLAGWKNPMYYVLKDIPKEGEFCADWAYREWKTNGNSVKGGKGL